MNCVRRIVKLRLGKYLGLETRSRNISNDVTSGSPVGGNDPLPFEAIPTERGLPVVGTVLDLIRAGGAPQLHKFIDNRHKRLGSIFREKLGPQNAVFVSSASLMRSVFLYEGQHPRHPLPESWTLYNDKHNCQRGLFFMNGPEWQHNRRIMNRFLLNGSCDWMNPHIEKCTSELIESWKGTASNDDEFVELENLEEQLYRWSIDVLCSLMFGKAFERISPQLSDKIGHFSRNVHKIFECSSPLMNFPPTLAESLKLKIWREFEKSVHDVLVMGNEIVDMHIAENTIQNGDGLLHMMTQCKMNMEVIKRIFVDLIIAAGDTTAFSSQWALYLLTSSTDIQTRVKQEIQGSKGVSEIPYVKGLIREALRLYPVAPFIGRFLATDAIVGGYEVGKDTLVLLSLYTSGRDQQHFSNPLQANPARWLRDPQTGELSDVFQSHGTLPFAIGSRSCIGRKIALRQMHSLIVGMSNNFESKCLNTTKIGVILRLVAVPNQKLRIGVKNV